ncbi:sensor domain-containing diguanylate cyclase [Nocardia wallacei]|uniref:sensor domain-containing diguanylate cyclase n=1 Tax=Nocardia wallacei TaxID=480035 RepID=UPI0024572329|nr:sensor domain-containing diguanylate cyclase [Nocardia wallacei]
MRLPWDDNDAALDEGSTRAVRTIEGVVVDEPEYLALASTWDRALAETVGAHDRRALLSELIGDLLAGLTAEPFDADVGIRVGEALARAQLTDPTVPIVSAQVLHGLADDVGHPDAARRLASLLVAIGLGHQSRVQSDTRILDRVRRDVDQRFRIVFDNAAIAIAVGDIDGVLLEANPHLADMIGVPMEQLRGISVYDFAHPDDQAEIRQLVYDKLVPAQEGTVRIERRLLRADSSVGWASFTITYVKGTGGQPDYLLALGEDVTERHRLQEKLRHQARHDPLTGLPNRRHLLDRIDEVIATAATTDRIGLCFADLDRFKHVNDHYGHGVGDQVLAAVAARLNHSVRDHDCLVARIGGDEFVALIPPPASTDHVTAMVDRLKSSLTEPITADGHRLQISASIGAVVTPVAGARPESLLDAADTSLYYAKANGRGHWVLHTLHAPVTR